MNLHLSATDGCWQLCMHNLSTLSSTFHLVHSQYCAEGYQPPTLFYPFFLLFFWFLFWKEKLFLWKKNCTLFFWKIFLTTFFFRKFFVISFDDASLEHFSVHVWNTKVEGRENWSLWTLLRRVSAEQLATSFTPLPLNRVLRCYGCLVTLPMYRVIFLLP